MSRRPTRDSARALPHQRRGAPALSVTAIFLAFGLSTTAPAQCSYTLRLLDEPPHPQCPHTPPAEGARDINNHGEAVGEYLICSGEIHPCRWDAKGTWSKIVIAGESKGSAQSINDDGSIVGYATINGDERWWHWQGGVVTLPEPPCPAFIDCKGVNAMPTGASAGTIYCIEPEETVHSYLHAGDGTWTDIGTELGDGTSLTYDASDSGFVVGPFYKGGLAAAKRAFRWRDGVAVILSPVIGGYTSQANGVNQWGDVVGSGSYVLPGWRRGDPLKGFTYIDGVFADPGFLPGMNSTGVSEINDLGQAIGWSGEWYIIGGEQQAVLIQHGEMHVLIDHVIDPVRFELPSVGHINDRGDITATVPYNGTNRVIVLEPVRERVGDVDLDCKVGVHDLTLVLKTWGSTYDFDHGPGDANNDHVVDGNDLALVLGGWDVP